LAGSMLDRERRRVTLQNGRQDLVDDCHESDHQRITPF
jgi:hypothetical protein